MAQRSLDIKAQSATPQAPNARFGPELALLIDTSNCIGCKACQMACMEWNERRDPIGRNVGAYDNPPDLSDQSWTVIRFAEVEMPPARVEWLLRKDGCMHCAEPSCLNACPAPGAIVQYGNGIVLYQGEKCIGCGACVDSCPFHIPRLSKKDGKARKCTFCSDRVAQGMEPVCAKTCPTGAIVFGSKEELARAAQGRISTLKAQGYPRAGLYDPQGVGGTHVIYLLKHADRPGLYHDLPTAPRALPRVAYGGEQPWVSLDLGLMLVAGFIGLLAAVAPDGVARDHQEENQP